MSDRGELRTLAEHARDWRHEESLAALHKAVTPEVMLSVLDELDRAHEQIESTARIIVDHMQAQMSCRQGSETRQTGP